MGLTVYLTAHDADGNEFDAFDAGITHNLGRMASEAGLYEAVWVPENHGYRTARDLIDALDAGLARLEAFPDYFMQFNAPNGWGVYYDLIEFLRKYIAACRKYPSAVITASR